MWIGIEFWVLARSMKVSYWCKLRQVNLHRYTKQHWLWLFGFGAGLGIVCTDALSSHTRLCNLTREHMNYMFRKTDKVIKCCAWCYNVYLHCWQAEHFSWPKQCQVCLSPTCTSPGQCAACSSSATTMTTALGWSLLSENWLYILIIFLILNAL